MPMLTSFSGRYNNMVIALYRPSIQIPSPTAHAALRCYRAAALVIGLSRDQTDAAIVDLTWVFLLTVYQAVNTLIWTLSYDAVRYSYPRAHASGLLQHGLHLIRLATQRWPGTSQASAM